MTINQILIFSDSLEGFVFIFGFVVIRVDEFFVGGHGSIDGSVFVFNLVESFVNLVFDGDQKI